jgi:D-alanine-D-alanine ligase
MKPKNICVLAGGDSDEREISLRSGAAVAKALEAAGYKVTQFDPANGISAEDVSGCDAVFPVLHGKGGEDGSIQTELEKFGVPYVGSDVAASELCFDKWNYKQFLETHDLPVPDGRLVDENSFTKDALYRQSFVLKPFDGGSSIDTFIHRGNGPVNQTLVQDIFSRHERLLLEELIAGTEITVAVVGTEALPVIEIVPPESGEFDYKNKYNGKSQELCPPKSVSEKLQARARELALRAHNLTRCRDFSRTDIMISKGGELYILETNTIPGMTDQSLLPKAALVAGMDMPTLVDKLAQMALNR